MRFWINIIVFLALSGVSFAVGAVASGWMIARDGRPSGLVTLCDQPVLAGLATLAGVAIGAVLGVLGVRRLGRRAGLFVAALALVGFAWGTGDVLGAHRAGGTSWHIIVESAAWSLVLTGLIRVFAETVSVGSRCVSAPRNAQSFLAIAAFLAAVWLLARSEMKGQAISAALLASLVGAFVWRISRGRGGTATLAAIPLLGGIAAVLSRLRWDGLSASEIPSAWSPWIFIMPQDYAAGALAGGVIGFFWAESLLIETAAEQRPDADLAARKSPPTLDADATADSTR